MVKVKALVISEQSVHVNETMTKEKAKAKRKNYSKSPYREELKESVEGWDAYRLEEEGHLCLKDYWSERVKGKIPLRTFYLYGNVDFSKRQRFGTQVGPKSGSHTAKLVKRTRKTKKQLIEREKVQDALGKYHHWLDELTMPPESGDVQSQQEREKKSRSWGDFFVCWFLSLPLFWPLLFSWKAAMRKILY